MGTPAQAKATAKYRKENVRQIVVRFYPKDYALYEWVKSKGRSTEYVLSLIRKDMGRSE